jgi:hypothetical protein
MECPASAQLKSSCFKTDRSTEEILPFLPVTTISVALLLPIFRTRSGSVLPRSVSPTLTSGRERTAGMELITMSQFINTSKPPPTASPLTAAILGFLPWRVETPQKPVGGRVPCCSIGALIHSNIEYISHRRILDPKRIVKGRVDTRQTSQVCTSAKCTPGVSEDANDKFLDSYPSKSKLGRAPNGPIQSFLFISQSCLFLQRNELFPIVLKTGNHGYL